MSDALLKSRVIQIKRSAKALKGGRRFSFSVLVVVGDGCGRVGLGFGKSREIADALLKGEESAARALAQVSLKGGALPHEVRGTYCGANVLLRPASRGTGIIASRTVRAVLECAGVKNAVSKSLGAQNAANVARATVDALMALRLAEQIYHGRDLKIPKTKTSVVLRVPELGTGSCDLGLN